jgi:DNA gyrase subunit A
MVVVRPENAQRATLLVATEFGRGKRTAVEDYRYQSRGGQGVINFRLNEQTGKVIAIKGVLPEDELMLITRNGVITRQRIAEIRVIGRNTQGVRLMALDQGDALVDVARIVPEDDETVADEVLLGQGGPPPDGIVPEPEGGYSEDVLPEVPEDADELEDGGDAPDTADSDDALRGDGFGG